MNNNVTFRSNSGLQLISDKNKDLGTPHTSSNEHEFYRKGKKESIISPEKTIFLKDTTQKILEKITVIEERFINEKSSLGSELENYLININQLLKVFEHPCYQLSYENKIYRKIYKKGTHIETRKSYKGPISLENSEEHESLHSICKKIRNLCLMDIYKDPIQALKDNWSDDDLQELKKLTVDLTDNINAELQHLKIPIIILTEKKKNKFIELFSHFTIKHSSLLNCVFTNLEESKIWDKVKHHVENFLKKHVLIDLRYLKFSKNQSQILRDLIPEGKDLLKKRKHLREDEKYKDQDSVYERNRLELEIILAYKKGLLEFTNTLNEYPNQLKFNDLITDLHETISAPLQERYLSEELIPAFFSAISSSIKIDYIETHLEDFLIKTIRKMLNEWKNGDGKNYPWRYEKLKKMHEERLEKFEPRDIMEEWRRALLGGYIEIQDHDGNTLLKPLEKPPEETTDIEKIIKLNEYLPKTEQVISQYVFGDFEGTLLTHFRKIVYRLILQSEPPRPIEESDLGKKFKKYISCINEKNLFEEKIHSILKKLEERDSNKEFISFLNYIKNEIEYCEIPLKKKVLDEVQKALEIGWEKVLNGENRSVLDMDERIFFEFSPLLKLLKEKKVLNKQAQATLTYVEKEISKTNPETIKNYGLKKVSIWLFIFYQILMQEFTTGTMHALLGVLLYLFPQCLKSIQAINEWSDDKTTRITVILGKEVSLRWQKTRKLHTTNCLLTQTLRMDLPSVDSENAKSEIAQEFQCNLLSSISEEETAIVNEHIGLIRLLLKAMEFPPDAFYKLT